MTESEQQATWFLLVLCTCLTCIGCGTEWKICGVWRRNSSDIVGQEKTEKIRQRQSQA